MFSSYHHVNSLVKNEDYVKKGDVIATLYKDEGEDEGKLVHLHFELSNGWNMGSRRQRAVNPEDIYPSFNKIRAEHQGKPKFRLVGLSKQPKINIANFKRLLVGN